MSHMRVSRPFVVERFVDPAMEAIALNGQQRVLVFNRTPQADSIIEHGCAIRPDNDDERHHLTRLLNLAVDLARLNAAEGQQVRGIARTADELASDLHRTERNGHGAPLKAKAIARLIREPLATIADGPAGARDFLTAAWAIADLFDQLPAAQIFTRALEHELGAHRFALLRDLYEQRKATTEGSDR